MSLETKHAVSNHNAAVEIPVQSSRKYPQILHTTNKFQDDFPSFPSPSWTVS